jgi:hypothetical protein
MRIFVWTSDESYWVTCSLGAGAGDGPEHTLGYVDYTMNLWSDACNAVQWEPTR